MKITLIKISTALLALLVASPLLAALRMPEPFKRLDTIAAPAIIAETFVNYMFIIPALAATVVLYMIGADKLNGGQKKPATILLTLSILVSIAGLAFMVFRSSTYS